MGEFTAWLQWFDASGWQGLVGLLLTVAGFAVTIVNVLRGRSAAEEAKRAADRAVAEVQKLKVVTDLSSSISELEGIRRLLREDSWHQVSERLSYVRKLLIGVGIRYPAMGEGDAARLKRSVVVFADVEKEIDRFHRGKSRINADRMNQTLIDETDALVEIISSMV